MKYSIPSLIKISEDTINYNYCSYGSSASGDTIYECANGPAVGQIGCNYGYAALGNGTSPYNRGCNAGYEAYNTVTTTSTVCSNGFTAKSQLASASACGNGYQVNGTTEVCKSGAEAQRKL